MLIAVFSFSAPSKKGQLCFMATFLKCALTLELRPCTNTIGNHRVVCHI